MNRSKVYLLQNIAIHRARSQLEEDGILNRSSSLDGVRDIAGEINYGIRSISKLSLKQREILIERLIKMGASVRNPHIYISDLKSESEGRGTAKIIPFSRVTERQLRMLDTLAAQIEWRGTDSYEHLCVRLFGAPASRNNKEATRLAAILRSMIEQQKKRREGS